MVENSFALKLCGVNSMGIATVAVLLIICLAVFSDCPSGVARPAKQPEFQLVLHQG